ncbi:unnamed protein product [Rotaria sp. Silwood1]|nr:unnamed protein product [Rotaria sp. Silwood1]CAF1028785.1 unnamed protein product [Rotaria sp. Silwood1]
MFARRNLRRNLVITFSLPIVLLTLFIIHKNRDNIFSEHSSHQYHGHISHFSQDINQIYTVRSKRSTSQIRSSTIHIDEQLQNQNSRIANPYTISLVNVLNNHKQLQDFNPIQQISYPVINTKNLERLVHLDLKGAAPKIDYYEKLFPFLKQLGATGLLIEYEDMFPFTNRLAVIKHGIAYSHNDIQKILQLAEMNGLKVMPLLQVYGHLEYVLKLKEFIHLREDIRYPQVITPCLEESYRLIFGMLN